MGYAETVSSDVAIYSQRKPKASPLWCLIDEHFSEFEELRERGLVTQEFVAKLMAWRHTSGPKKVFSLSVITVGI